MKHGDQPNQQMLPSRTSPVDVALIVRRAADAIVSRERAPPHSRTSEHAAAIPSSTLVASAPVSVETNTIKPEPGYLSTEDANSIEEHVPNGAAATRVWHRGADLWNNKVKSHVYYGARLVTYGVAAWFAIVITMIVVYRFVDPPASNLMLYHYAVGRDVKQTWTPLKKISPAVIKAVITAEDARFCRHWGIDFIALEQAIEAARGGSPRGASTITMQTAKNMFLWQSKSYIRKILEVPVTILLELIWGKKRILEVYLNVAEWGPGVFGIGAAAKHHFKTVPAKLGSAAAAQLAASLPNPKIRRAGRPGPKTRRKARVIRGRARNASYYTACILR